MNRNRIVMTLAVVALAVLAGTAQAELMGQLGLLDLTANGGINPGTGSPWALGDPYHLTYITDTTRDAASTDIADYNTFVDGDADAAGIGTGVSWFAMGSTATVDAKDNAVVTGPVLNVYLSTAVATDATDLWDLKFVAKPTMLDGSARNVWFGTIAGGLNAGGYALGSSPNVRYEWSGWADWGGAWKSDPNTYLKELVAISEELNIVPEPSTFALALLGLLGLIGFARRRRK